MSGFIDGDPTQRIYMEVVREPSAFEALKEPMRIILAGDMLSACNALMSQTTSYIEDRLPRAIGEQREIARRMTANLPHAWKSPEEWPTCVRHSLDILRQQMLDGRVSGLEQWETWEELETDIHISAHCSLKATELFLYGSPPHLGDLTSALFAVPEDFAEFLGSLIVGDIRPLWMWQVYAADTPACFDGMYPRYRPSY